jgi:hypothetical protein
VLRRPLHGVPDVLRDFQGFPDVRAVVQSFSLELAGGPEEAPSKEKKFP